MSFSSLQRLVLQPPLYTSVVFLFALLAVRDPPRNVVGPRILIVSINDDDDDDDHHHQVLTSSVALVCDLSC